MLMKPPSQKIMTLTQNAVDYKKKKSTQKVNPQSKGKTPATKASKPTSKCK